MADHPPSPAKRKLHASAVPMVSKKAKINLNEDLCEFLHELADHEKVVGLIFPYVLSIFRMC